MARNFYRLETVIEAGTGRGFRIYIDPDRGPVEARRIILRDGDWQDEGEVELRDVPAGALDAAMTPE